MGLIYRGLRSLGDFFEDKEYVDVFCFFFFGLGSGVRIVFVFWK